MKHSNPCRLLVPIMYYEYPKNSKLGIVNYLKYYLGIRNTKVCRKVQEITKFTAKQLLTDTASWWIKDGQSSAGVHTAVFKSHCGRSASSSKAQGIGIPV